MTGQDQLGQKLRKCHHLGPRYDFFTKICYQADSPTSEFSLIKIHLFNPRRLEKDRICLRQQMVICVLKKWRLDKPACLIVIWWINWETMKLSRLKMDWFVFLLIWGNLYQNVDSAKGMDYEYQFHLLAMYRVNCVKSLVIDSFSFVKCRAGR